MTVPTVGSSNLRTTGWPVRRLNACRPLPTDALHVAARRANVDKANAQTRRRCGAAAALAWDRSGLERRLAHPLPQLRALLELGVDVDSLDEHQATPLHVAVRACADPLPS